MVNPQFGLPTWFDITTSEPGETLDFYTHMFDWTAEPAQQTPFGEYVVFYKDGLPATGLVIRNAMTPQPDGWLSYLSVKDIGATLAKVEVYDGAVCRPPIVLSGLGTLAVVTDPADSPIGLIHTPHSADQRAAGPATAVWTEIETVGWPATFEFMTSVFDLRTEQQSDIEGSRFATILDNEHPRGGIFELEPDVTFSRWEVAFLVADAAQAVNRAVASGARTVRPVYDVPVGTGKGARLADPTGSHFNIISF